MSKSTELNAQLKSSKTNKVRDLLSMAQRISSVTLSSAVTVLWPVRKPDWKGEIRELVDRYLEI